jgi:hypothetical protein
VLGESFEGHRCERALHGSTTTAERFCSPTFGATPSSTPVRIPHPKQLTKFSARIHGTPFGVAFRTGFKQAQVAIGLELQCFHVADGTQTPAFKHKLDAVHDDMWPPPCAGVSTRGGWQESRSIPPLTRARKERRGHTT